MKLVGKVAIVTGGATGFGEGIARRYAHDGASVIVGDNNPDLGNWVVTEIERVGGRARFVQVDVTQNDDVQRMVELTLSAFGQLDILVNAASFAHANQPMLNVPESLFDRVFSVNCKSLYLTALHAVPVFRRSGHGAIVNVTSTGGVRPRPGLTWYNGSKGAAITLTKSMAVELAPEGIRVNAINPVIGDTDLLPTYMGMKDTRENRSKFLATIPLGRLSRPEDIGAAAVFLASDDASFVTGVCMDVDGGRCI